MAMSSLLEPSLILEKEQALFVSRAEHQDMVHPVSEKTAVNTDQPVLSDS